MPQLRINSHFQCGTAASPIQDPGIFSELSRTRAISLAVLLGLSLAAKVSFASPVRGSASSGPTLTPTSLEFENLSSWSGDIIPPHQEILIRLKNTGRAPVGVSQKTADSRCKEARKLDPEHACLSEGLTTWMVSLNGKLQPVNFGGQILPGGTREFFVQEPLNTFTQCQDVQVEVGTSRKNLQGPTSLKIMHKGSPSPLLAGCAERTQTSRSAVASIEPPRTAGEPGSRPLPHPPSKAPPKSAPVPPPRAPGDIPLGEEF